jgi:PAS domain S-box-containing protein
VPDRRRARARPRATPAKILVVWDNKIIRRLVRLTLQAEAYEVIEAGDAATALALAPRERPDLILQDLRLPDLDGFDLLRRLRALPEIVDVPVIAISGFVSRLAEARASAIGFSDFLVKPLQPTELLRAIQAHLPSRVTAPGAGANQRVLFVDDDPVQRKLGRLQLEAYGFRVQTADDGVEALAMARTHPFDVVVSDVLMPRLDGFGLCLAIRQDLHLAHLPVVLCSNTYLDADDEALGQRLGASAFVARTADMNTVADAALAALHQGSVPTPVGLPTELHDRHVYRIISQLEHQAALNAGLARRCASQSAALTILSTISDTLAKSLDRDFGIDEVLGSCLEAGGFLVGTLYLLDGAGRLRVNAQSGYYRRASRDDVERLFGHEPLFRAALERGTPLAIPSPAVAEATAREFLSRTGVSAALILPIVFRDERLGALVVAADPTDLSHEESLDFARTIGHQIGQVIALRRAFTRMATAEQEYRGIFEHAVEGIFRATPDGRYLLVNPAMAGIFGYATPDDMVTSLTDMWTELHADPGERDALLHLLSSRGSVSRFEGQARRRDGTVIWISQSVRAVHDVDGRVVYYEGLLEDITERKRTEAALRQSEKLAAMSSLVAGLAHELNNPLSVILAHSTLLAARGATNAQARASKIVQAA